MFDLLSHHRADLQERAIRWCENHPDTAARTLPVSELFGTTIQGEGPHAGRVVQFLRLGGCNLSCTWCDTPYTWDATRFDLSAELTPTTARQIVEDLIPGVVLVISGGEPLMHQRNAAWAYVLHGAVSRGCEVHVETNGTIAPTAQTNGLVTHYSVSPKMGHAGDHKGRDTRLHDDWLPLLDTGQACLKYVVRDADDTRTVAEDTADLGVPRHAVWVMPLGTSTEELQGRWPGVARAAADHHVNASHRTHVLAWGDTKGT